MPSRNSGGVRELAKARLDTFRYRANVKAPSAADETPRTATWWPNIHAACHERQTDFSRIFECQGQNYGISLIVHDIGDNFSL